MELWAWLVVGAAVAFAGLWVLSPIDLIPEFLPVIGPLDDVVMVALALRYAARQVPRDVLSEAWAGNPASLRRLLGDVLPAADVARLSDLRGSGVITDAES